MNGHFASNAVAGGYQADAAVPPGTPMSQALERVNSLLHRLDDAISHTSDKLQPILTPDFPEPTKAGAGPIAASPPRSDVVRCIEDFADRIESQVNRTLRLAGRVEA